jgi:hypothetical protein
MPKTMQSEPSRTRCGPSFARTSRSLGMKANSGLLELSTQRQSRRRGRGRRREVVGTEEDVVKADEDEALRLACQTQERVEDEGTAWCCQYRASEGRNHN